MPDAAEKVVETQIALAWRDFLANMDLRYPRNGWTNEALETKGSDLLTLAAAEAAEERYQTAAEMRADARDIDGLLFSRGDFGRAGYAEDIRRDMARVIVGEGPQPRIVTGHHPETGEPIDLVLSDAESNLASLAA